MTLLGEAANAIGGVLLQVAVGLLIEELTFAGLIRLIFVQRPGKAGNKGTQSPNKWR